MREPAIAAAVVRVVKVERLAALHHAGALRVEAEAGAGLPVGRLETLAASALVRRAVATGHGAGPRMLRAVLATGYDAAAGPQRPHSRRTARSRARSAACCIAGFDVRIDKSHHGWDFCVTQLSRLPNTG